MRASILNFIFILSEFTIITAEECGDPPKIKNAEKVNNVPLKFRMGCNKGYIRKAGTSNLFKCENNTWRNSPTLECIFFDTLIPTVPPSPSSSAKTPDLDKHQGEDNLPTDGTIVFTTTSKTFQNISKRITTWKEITLTSSAPALPSTENEKLTTLCIPSSSITEKTAREGIVGGIVMIGVLGVAVTVAILYWRHRSRRLQADCNPVEMQHQNPVTPFIDTPVSVYTDAPFSA